MLIHLTVPNTPSSNIILLSIVQSYIMNPARESEAKTRIDDVIRSKSGRRKFLFPMNSTGNIEGGKLDHWTLLAYDSKTCTWTHYNSLKNRREDYLKDAAKLVQNTQTYYKCFIHKKNHITTTCSII